MNLKNLHLCFIGSMLGKNPKHVTTQGQVLAELIAKEGLEVTCVSSKINRVLRLIEIILTLIRGRKEFSVVIIELYSGLGFLIAYIAGGLCRLFDLPLILVLHGGNLPEFSKRFPKSVSRVLKRADSLVAPSRYLVDGLSTFGIEITEIPNIVDLEDYPRMIRTSVAPRLIWMRSFHPIYNPQMAIEVLKALKTNYPEATLTMAGPDKGLEGEIRELVQQNRLSDSIRFVGFLDIGGKIEEFSKADIYLNTNRIDNMPVSVVEARAMGLPVVATDVGGLPFLINHGENGLLGPSGDVPKMVKNIELLLERPDLVHRFSLRGRRIAQSSGWTEVKAAWEQQIEAVVSEHIGSADRLKSVSI